MAIAALPPPGSNGRVALLAAAGAAAMLALGFASVPLYRLFCQVTGFNGTTMRVSEAQAASVRASARTISIRFDGNVDRGMPWRFGPDQVTQEVRIGARSLASFTAKNTSAHAITGRASFNVSPDVAGKYFSKIECFCFTEQTLAPGQEVRMPVVYYVDPKLLDDEDARDLEQITLSYTFHEDKGAETKPQTSGKALDRAATTR